MVCLFRVFYLKNNRVMIARTVISFGTPYNIESNEFESDNEETRLMGHCKQVMGVAEINTTNLWKVISSCM